MSLLNELLEACWEVYQLYHKVKVIAVSCYIMLYYLYSYADSDR